MPNWKNRLLKSASQTPKPAALPLQMDVTRRAEVDAAVERAIAHFGGVDILVNNVGGGPEGGAPRT